MLRFRPLGSLAGALLDRLDQRIPRLYCEEVVGSKLVVQTDVDAELLFRSCYSIVVCLDGLPGSRIIQQNSGSRRGDHTIDYVYLYLNHM